MLFKKQPSQNGYDLLTPHGVTFDLADVEVWAYLGVGEDVAGQIVRGFPTFWQESGAAKKQQQDASRLAETHRVNSIGHIARDEGLAAATANDNPFAELSQYRQDVACGGPFNETQDPLAGTPFAGVGQTAKEKYLREHAAPLEVPLQEWKEAACYLFDQLLEQSPEHLKPDCLQVGEKHRCQQGDGSPRDRGARMTTQADLESLFSPSSENCVQWGPLHYDIRHLNVSHCCVAGVPCTGKTTILRLLFQSIYRTQGEHARFIIYDPKLDLLPYLYPPEYFREHRSQDEIDSEFYILNPLDRRCTPWDIAQDAADDASALEVAEILFPDANENEDDKEYFAPACRDIAMDAMDALRRIAGGPYWTFYDLVCALQRQNVQAVLSTTPRGRSTCKEYLSKPGGQSTEDTYKSLTVRTKSMIAAAHEWLKSQRKPISLREWEKSDLKSIVLTSQKRNSKPLMRINRLLLGMLCRLLVNRDKDSLKTYLYLDEFEQLGRIDSIITVGQQGASKGVNLALSLHTIELLRRAYGFETEGLLALCNFFAFLRTGGLETSKWAADSLGRVERQHLSETRHFGDENGASQGYSTTASQHETTLVMPDEIRFLPFPETSQQITGYFITPQHCCYRGSIRLASLYAQDDSDAPPVLWPKSPLVSEFIGSPDPVVAPDDTFATLLEMGFHRDDYAPPIEASAARSQSSAASRPAPTHQTIPVRVKTDVRFNFDLDD